MIFHRYRYIALLLFLCMSFFVACGKKDVQDVTESSSEELSVTLVAESPTPEPTSTPAPVPEVEITQTVAKFFPNLQGYPTLYAALEYKNTGAVAVCIEKADCKFNTGQFLVEGSFSPMLCEDDYILPGQSATLALWQTYAKEPDLSADAQISVEVTLTPQEYDQTRVRRKMAVTNLNLEDNYPNFATLSGTLINTSSDRDYALSLTYVSFYDTNNQLLGVWHFTENMAIPADETRNFVVHLKTLPISNLSEDATKIEGRSIGID